METVVDTCVRLRMRKHDAWAIYVHVTISIYPYLNMCICGICDGKEIENVITVTSS